MPAQLGQLNRVETTELQELHRNLNMAQAAWSTFNALMAVKYDLAVFDFISPTDGVIRRHREEVKQN